MDRAHLVTLLVALSATAATALGVTSAVAARRMLLRVTVDDLEDDRPPLSRTRAVLRAVAGLALAGAGVVLLFLPGPGVALIGLGLLMLGRRWRARVIRRLVQRPRVLRQINAFRARHGRPPILV